MNHRDEKTILDRLMLLQKENNNRPRPILLRYGDGHEEKTLEYAYPNGILSTRYVIVENYPEWLFFFKGENQFRRKELSELVSEIIYLESGEKTSIKDMAQSAAEHPLTEEDYTEIKQELQMEHLRKG